MRTLAAILEEAASLRLKGKVAKLVDELLQRGLDLEGPPPEPIKGISRDYRRTFIRTMPTLTRPNGTPTGMAATWVTDTWRCLLLEIPSCPMARPQRPHQNHSDASNNTNGTQGRRNFIAPAMAVLDSKSRRFQAKVVDACRCLDLNQSYQEAAIACILGTDRTFLAWRERQEGETFNAMLRGDTDNYTKNCLDGLQKAHVISNDRGVFRLVATKSLPTTWLTAPISVTNEITKAALELRAKGESYQNIKNNLILSYEKMANIFPNYQPTKLQTKGKYKTGRDAGRPPIKDYTAEDLTSALMIAEREGLRAARRQTGVPITQIKAVLVAKLGIIPKRAGRPSKALPKAVIEKIQTLAQNGNRVTDIQKTLLLERETSGGVIVSIRKIRKILNLNQKGKHSNRQATDSNSKQQNDIATEQ
jgi:Holliday junction resolvase RusA-like endonuclease